MVNVFNQYFMENSLLVKILTTIPKNLHSELLKFINSPFFNEKEEIIAFVECLLTHYPFKKPFSKEECFSIVFPQKAYNDSKMRQLMSATKKVVEQYLVVTQMQKNDYQADAMLVDYYRKYDLAGALQPKIKGLEKSVNQPKFIDEKYFYKKYRLAVTKAGVLSEQGANERNKNFKELYGNQLKETIEELNKYYFFQVLNLYSISYNFSTLFESEFEMGFVQEILKEVLENEVYQETVPLNMLAHSLIFLSDMEQENHYFKLKSLLETHAHKIEPYVATNFYRRACSYCIRQIHQEKEVYCESLFELYQTMLEQNLILVRGNFPTGTFKNIVNLALRLDKDEWVEKFIKDNHNKLAGENPDDILNFALALLEFKKGNHQQVLDLLNQVEALKDLYYNIEAKRLFLKVFYELDLIDILYAQMNAFKVYIHRNKLITNLQKKMNRKFVNVLIRIVELPPKQEKKFLKLKEKISLDKELYERNWLLEKMENHSLYSIKKAP